MTGQKLGQFKINAVLFFHLVWVSLIYLSWPLVVAYPGYNKFFYFPLVAITLAARTLLEGDCWLTNVENDLRRKYAPATVYNDTDKCCPYYSEKWLKYRITKPVIMTAFTACFLLSALLFVKQLL